MKVSLQWLREMVATELPVAELAPFVWVSMTAAFIFSLQKAKRPHRFRCERR